MASRARFDDKADDAAAAWNGDDAGRAGLAAFRVLAGGDQGRSLPALIESEIIPRLMVAHRLDPPAPIADAAVADADITALVPLTLELEADALVAHVETMLARGLSVESLLIDLLAPAARLLGEYWESDQCDFVEVTMGLWRLQEVVHELSARMPAASGPRALFAAMPGEQHSFGTVLIDEMFRRGGWVTERLIGAETPELLRCVAAESFDLLGLTISCDCHIGALTPLIAALRNISRNPQLSIMVGGRVLVADPSLAARVGADATASDARLALKMADDLLRVRGERVLAGR